MLGLSSNLPFSFTEAAPALALWQAAFAAHEAHRLFFLVLHLVDAHPTRQGQRHAIMPGLQEVVAEIVVIRSRCGPGADRCGENGMQARGWQVRTEML